MLSRLKTIPATLANRARLSRLTREVARKAGNGGPRVAVFNASARLHGLSLNAAFSLLASWGLRLEGVDVIHFVCNAALSHCVLGTDRDDPAKAPPCADCIAQSKRLYVDAKTWYASPRDYPQLAEALKGLTLDQLSSFTYQNESWGPMVIPSLRWILRRYNLPDDRPTRGLLREYIIGAYHIQQVFGQFLDETKPEAVIVFNGIMYPEAAARRAAQNRRIRVITHEVSFQPFSAFFTEGEATAYPIHIPSDFELNEEQNMHLDDYLQQRFQGDFSMAGIRFWPEMKGLDEDFLKKAEGFKQIVPILTNVIFDTSQVHANTVFPHMFAWLDLILEIIKAQPETLFVIRAHPDEMRPGTRKAAREHVRGWVEENRVTDLSNVVLIDSEEYVSSYALMQRAKFIMVYNSSVGLEGTLLDVPVLCGGRARFTQYPTVFFPQSAESYRALAQEFLIADHIEIPAEFKHNARRFLYYQLFKTALPFDRFLTSHPRVGYVQLQAFKVDDLRPGNAPAIRAIVDGVSGHGDFLV